MEIIVITKPDFFENESSIVKSLFDEGLHCLHLRKKDVSPESVCEFIDSIPEEYHSRIVIHDFPELISRYRLKGIHFNYKTADRFSEFCNVNITKSYSAHSFDEIEQYSNIYNYFFISPVANSISKTGYSAGWTTDELIENVDRCSVPEKLVALGGVCSEITDRLTGIGFNRFALLGTIWDSNNPVEAYREIKERNRPFVLSVAGYDPSAGAGVMADVKTCEQIGAYGLAVNSATTIQNESSFEDVDWCSGSVIERQIICLAKTTDINIVKIGLIQDIDTLISVLKTVKDQSVNSYIIWDPIVKASAGFTFHSDINRDKLYEALKYIDLITPNKPEAEQLFGGCDVEDIRNNICIDSNISILLKGGHGIGDTSVDILIKPDGVKEFTGVRHKGFDKHGTGCVLSAAIASYLSLGLDINNAILRAKQYVSKLIISNSSLLGYHNIL
ncbi:MAG: bifunctional hydroxymethylpyrimidine kinase/phosphomethylpyrimidine kinase [Bacteroidales bacterium]|jgi:thiamine-phosphate pyrophosphorylase|nr:bifunctional hydroxymethylpyrimidine kinase/phosphomethylpyrimidine kinase [Bacteroidales bacterium]